MKNKIHLKIIEGNDIGTLYELENEEYEICRALPSGMPSKADRKNIIFLRDSEVSKKHARISKVSDELLVEDLGSTNGTFINNKRITKSLLLNNDRLRIGTTVFQLIIANKKENADRTFVGPSSAYSKPTHDFKKMAKIMDDTVKFSPDILRNCPYQGGSKAQELYLEIVNTISNIKDDDEDYSEMSNGVVKSYYFEVEITDSSDNKGARYRFFRRQISVGRVGDLMLNDDAVSREHALISIIGNSMFKVRDLGSQNGTYINDSKVQIATFTTSDTIKIGNTSMKLSIIEVE